MDSSSVGRSLSQQFVMGEAPRADYLEAMSEADSLFATLRQSADADAVAALSRLVRDGTDRDLCRINVLAFAKRNGLNEQRVISAFLHAARLGLFDLSWNVLCPSCGGVLDAGA